MGKPTFILAFLTIAGFLWSAEAAEPAVQPPPRLAELQNDFSQVAEKAFPTVVVITNKRRAGGDMYPNLSPEMRYFFGLPPASKRSGGKPLPVGRGSGFFIRADGYLLTNCHVIQGADALEVKLSDGRTFDNATDRNAVKVVGIDEDSDLAVLKIPVEADKPVPALAFADTSALKIGEWAIAIGAPFNLENTMTVGIVSQKGRNDVGPAKYQDYIQTDASINPGNSGGPLLDIRGRVIGINNFIMTGGGGGSIGLGFAIAGNFASKVAETLIKDGRIRRPHLNAAMMPLTADLQEAFGADFGVVVQQVEEGGAADQAGIRPGDVIQQVAGEKMLTPQDVLAALALRKPDEQIDITVMREGKPLKLKLRDTSLQEPPAGPEERLDLLGCSVVASRSGLRIATVDPDGLAAQGGLEAGDLLVAVNRTPTTSVATFEKALRQARRQSAQLQVYKQSGERMTLVLSVR